MCHTYGHPVEYTCDPAKIISCCVCHPVSDKGGEKCCCCDTGCYEDSSYRNTVSTQLGKESRSVSSLGHMLQRSRCTVHRRVTAGKYRGQDNGIHQRCCCCKSRSLENDGERRCCHVIFRCIQQCRLRKRDQCPYYEDRSQIKDDQS